jgi:zinc protease
MRVLALALAFGLAFMASAAQAVEVKEVTTPLGIKAWLVEDKSTPLMALAFSFAGGSARDPETQRGITSLTATLLTDGAGPFDAQAFKLRQEEAAVSLGFGASLDNVSGSLRLLSVNRDEGFDLLRLAVSAPRFDQDRFEERRAQAIASSTRPTSGRPRWRNAP